MTEGDWCPPERRFPQILPIGLSGVLIRFSDDLTDKANQTALVFRAIIDEAAIAGVLETSTSLTSTFLYYDPGQIQFCPLQERLHALLTELDSGLLSPPAGRKLWRIPAVFGGDDGPQLEEAADLAGTSPEQAIADLCRDPLNVLTLGFAPGQPYLGTLAEEWDIPRQRELTQQVPAASLVVAVRQVVLFANATPTGWRQVGQTAFSVFRPDSEDPFPLKPGDQVKFEEISSLELARIRKQDSTGAGGAQCEVLA